MIKNQHNLEVQIKMLKDKQIQTGSGIGEDQLGADTTQATRTII